MTRFEAALDDSFDELEKKLGRMPNSDEAAELRDRLFQSWVQSSRFDELIEYIQDYHELEGGFGDCSIVCEALKRAGDLVRIEKLFEGLLKARKMAHSRVWSQAQDGHIGAMREAATHLAAVLEAYAGLYHSYWSLQNEEGMARVKAEMLYFQANRADPSRPRRNRSDA
jgi:hypothetical protein